ncbi:ABC transporter permease [Kineococcus sp. LSe6-4]|uniref:ABC transporter permease n=1 Tax=Kineococcus halophytocola TaxID=3234027 RepID=A0ABV4H1T8_9ACTN
MIPYVLRRLVSAVVLLFAITFFAFVLLTLAAGGDTARNVLGDAATPEQITQLNADLGLDQPVLVQYWNWLLGALQGDLGRSWFTSQGVTEAVADALPVSLSVLLPVIVVSGVVAFTIGLLCAVRRGWLDRTFQVLSTLADAVPNFLVGVFLATLLGVQLALFPAVGYVSPERSLYAWAATLVLPVTALSIGAVAGVAQQVRSAAIGVLRQDYVRTLRSRGLSQRRIVLTSVLRNSSTTGFTMLGLQFVGLLGGSVVVEQVFALPGLGTLAVTNTSRGDLPLVMGVIVAAVTIVVLVNLVVDLVVAWLNPKARLA